MMRSHTPPSAISGVLYAEDFDEPLLLTREAEPAASAIPAEPELIDPRFSLDELRAATEQAHEEGCEAGRHAAARSLEAQRGAALAAIAEQISATQAESVRRVEQALDAIANATFSLLAAALPALCATHTQDELRAVLHRVLPAAQQVPELHIRVHPSMRAAIETEANALLEGSGTRVTCTDSTKLLAGDIAISWQNGAALRDTTAICAEIRNTVLALFGSGYGTLAGDPGWPMKST